MISASSSGAWLASPARHSRTAASTTAPVDDRGVARVRARSRIGPTTAPPSAREPRADRLVEEAALALASARSRGRAPWPPSRRTCLPWSRCTLWRVGIVAHSSTNSWSRNGTRTSSEHAIERAVEVREHVVDEAELRVEVERRLERRRAGRAREVPAQHALGGVVLLGQRAAEQPVAQVGSHERRSRRAGARRGRGACSASTSRPARPGPRPQRRRPSARAGPGTRSPASRRATRRGACGSRRTARRRPGPRAPR